MYYLSVITSFILESCHLNFQTQHRATKTYCLVSEHTKIKAVIKSLINTVSTPYHSPRNVGITILH